MRSSEARLYEERNNDDKEEELLFGEEESGKIRMLGSWMGWREDVEEKEEARHGGGQGAG